MFRFGEYDEIEEETTFKVSREFLDDWCGSASAADEFISSYTSDEAAELLANACLADAVESVNPVGD